MKKFIEELNDSNRGYLEMQVNDPVTQDIFNQLRMKYSKAIGQRALLCVSRKENKVVTIEEVNKWFVLVSYMNYGKGYADKVHSSISLQSIYCGDEELALEDE